jgi:HAE1 family hydrophobic/amphiphilic exporter-1
MTTFALIAGMVPVALGLGEGGDFRAPLGRVVIGGVLTSTILTLIVIPSVYDLLCEMRLRAVNSRKDRRKRKESKEQHSMLKGPSIPSLIHDFD